MGRPWSVLPQWSSLVAGLLEVLSGLGVRRCDVVAHSYGTAVANRLLRELCFGDHAATAAAAAGGEELDELAEPRRVLRSATSAITSPAPTQHGRASGASSSSSSSLSSSSFFSSSSSGAAAAAAVRSAAPVVVGFLGLVDPITLGGASCGLVGVINQQGRREQCEREAGAVDLCCKTCAA